MKAIIFNNIELAEELLKLINDSVEHLFDRNTTSFTYIINHPTENKFAVPVGEVKPYWDIIQKVIKVSELEEINLKEWYPQEKVETEK